MDNFCEDQSGLLYIVNGFDPMLRWDGQSAMAVLAGLVAPTSALTMSGSGQGGIVGTYFAYTRFVDNLGFFSNLSPISAQFTAQNAGTTGNIADASFTAPIEITSAAHGLTTGTIVKVSGVGGNTSANGIWTITVIDANTFSLDGSSGNATYTGSGTWISGISKITYNNVPLPSDPKVVRRQILRNLDGETATFYVDVDTTDLVSTTFSSTETDTQLGANESQPILDDAGLPLANLRYVPPSHKTTLESHLTRLFLAGQYHERRGSAVVTNGSASVQGIGTDWVATLANRYFRVLGGTQSYQISSVDVLNQIITLTSSYVDDSDNFAMYSIDPAPAEARLVYYTPAGQPESWPPFYALSVQEDNDEITSLMARGSFLYILEKRHIYKFTFQDDPAVDGAIFLSANRGCINNRCHVLVDGDAYMLDEHGIHKFTSGGQIEQLSEPIGEIFRPGSLYKFQINWNASRYFHAVAYRPQETIRWFVALEGDFLPKHALCFNYRLKRWWIERYPFWVGGGKSGDINNTPYVFISGENTKTYAIWTGESDIADPNVGTIRGTVTSAGVNWLQDSLANFALSGIGSVINAPVTIIDGTGKGQRGRVTSVSGSQLNIWPPWTQALDTTSVYQTGGVTWNWKSTWLRLSNAETMADRAIEMLFLTTEAPATMDLRTSYDFGSAEVQRIGYTSKQGAGVRTDPGKTDKVIDLTKPSGVVLIRVPGHRERFTDGRRYFQVEIGGTTNQDPCALFEMILEGEANAAVITQGGE